jgi:sterol desaturase/sphingolipid hydroxylase (fatty acid hydroxylase superfamily)
MRYNRVSCAERRQHSLEKIPSWYNPWFHLLVPSSVGLILIYAATTFISEVLWWEYCCIPFFWLASNALEWRAHRDLLHRRFYPLEDIYRRHIEHHGIYTNEDMSIRDRREYRLVLLPFVGVLLIFIGLIILGGLLYAFSTTNLTCLFLSTTIAYVLSYEWLHLSYHLPPEHPIGKLAFIQKLRTHHQLHHSSRLMQRWNFNVTIPLWDVVRGTVYKGPELEEEE